ncbi:MAG: phosphate ABC transporter permease subunit PstC [Firmicutes bacterium]|nr:phosphate ABC transporter permease subunit PstC [Bacillota bacterium]
MEAGGIRLRSRIRENLIRVVLTMVAFSSLVFLVGIVLVLFREGLPIFRKIGLAHFIFGRDWYPTYDPPSFGILPLMAASFLVTVGAMVVAIPIGVASAITISQVLPGRVRGIIKPVVELLAGVPSVVYGLFGMQVMAPLVMNVFGLPTGLTALTASIILGIMALPTVVSIAEDALSAVPGTYREASYALGATRWETISRVLVPAASSGIVTASLLGMGRAIGETMTVLMVAGGAAVVPTSFLQPVRPMTATIAAEMGEAPVGGSHYHALFAIAIVLFVVTLAFNMVADGFTRRFQRKVAGGR